MNKKKSVKDLICLVESEYDVTSIKLKSFPIWLLIRNYFYFKVTQGSKETLNLSLKQKLISLISSFKGFINFFKQSDAWFFCITIDRVLIDGKYFDKYVDFPARFFKKSLHIEIPFFRHFSKNEVYSKRVASKAFLILLETIYTKIFLNKISIENEHVLKSIFKEYNIDFNYQPAAKKMVAQYLILKFILKFNRPKYVFFGTSYTNYGYIKALREKGVKIYEIQHGVISQQHFGYMVHAKFDKQFFPDKLCTFGSTELDTFLDDDNNGIRPENIVAIGNFYLDYIYKNFKKDKIYSELFSKYLKSISVSLQDSELGDKLIPFIIFLAEQNTDIIFLIKRRKYSQNYYYSNFKIPLNMVFLDELNVYEIILYSDLHITINSSCALEAPFLGVKNLLINIDNFSETYFGSILPKDSSIILPPDKEIIGNYFTSIKNEVFDPLIIKKGFSTVISSNYDQKMTKFLNENIEDQYTI